MALLKLTENDYNSAATKLGVDIATIKAVAEVESSGSGFQKDGRPRILYEGHLFSRYTSHKYDEEHPSISHPKWIANNPQYKVEQYPRLEEAKLLDEEAALKSTSWGAFQILGANYKAAGFDSVTSFVEAMKGSEADHLRAFVTFVKSNGLEKYLQNKDWAGFAKRYNGGAYEKNKYDVKLENAYNRHSGTPQPPSTSQPVLREGASGDSVRQLQEQLQRMGYNVGTNGVFDSNTKTAVEQFQKDHGLKPDGIVGKNTLSTLSKADNHASLPQIQRQAYTPKSQPSFKPLEQPRLQESLQKLRK